MGWFASDGCDGCDSGSTPCFCTGSFTDFQITIANVVYDTFTGYGAESCEGTPDHINGTHVLPIASSSAWYCTGYDEIDGASGTDATYPTQRYTIRKRYSPSWPFSNPTLEESCDCNAPLQDPCATSSYGTCNIGGACLAGFPYSTSSRVATHLIATIQPLPDVPGSFMRLTALLLWPEEIVKSYGLTSEPSSIERFDIAYGGAYWAKDVAVGACTSVSETLTLQYYYQGVCPGTATINAGLPCDQTNRRSQEGTYDFSSATLTYALI